MLICIIVLPNPIHMKKLFLLLVILFSVTFSNRAQIPFGDFTTWVTDSIGRLEPLGWVTTNALFDTAGIEQDIDRLGGSGFSARIHTVYDSAIADFRFVDMILENQPFTNTQNPTVLTGYWKNFNPNTADGLAIEVWVYDSTNTEIGHQSKITPISTSVPIWTFFSLTIDYTSSNPVTSYKIYVSGYNLSNQPGAYSHIDDLAFDVSVGIENPKLSEIDTRLRRFENNNYILDLQEISESVSIDLIDYNGRNIKNIYTGIEKGSFSVSFDLNEYADGVYFCKIICGNNNKMLRLVKFN